MRAVGALLLALSLLAGTVAGWSTARAETPPAPPPSVETGTSATVEELESLVSTIEDEGRRAELVKQLKALIEARKGTVADHAAGEPGFDSFLAGVSDHIREAAADVVETAALILDLPSLWQWFEREGADPYTRERWLASFLQIVVAIGAAAIAYWLVWRLIARPRHALDRRETPSLLIRVFLAFARLALDLLPIAVFAAVAYGVLPLVKPGEEVRVIALALINAVIGTRLVLALARLLLAPSAPGLRLLPFHSETAAYVFVWIRRFATLAIYGHFGLAAAALLGLPPALYGLLRNLIGLLMTALLVLFVLQVRHGVADWLRGSERPARSATIGAVRAYMADIWHIFAIGYLVAGYVVWALRIAGGSGYVLRGTLLTVLIVVATWLATVGIRRLVEYLFAIGRELSERYPLLERRANRYLPVLQAALRWIVCVIALLAVLEVWGVDAFDWLTAPAGRGILGHLVTIAIVLVVALVVWELVSGYIERRLARPDAGASARLRTLLPLARRSLLVILVVMVSLIILSEIGVDIAPLLAGAGIVGLAIGFGSQALVKDVITGFFILMEDSVAVGDIAEVAGRGGSVESMTIRSIRLRDYDGHVHTVPFSEVTTVRNMTKDFAFSVVNLNVAYRENVDEVLRVVQEVADGLRTDPAFAPYIVGPLDIAGLDQFGESGVGLRVRFKVVPPIQQWTVRREFHRRLKAAFDEKGIEIAIPHLRLWFGEDRQGESPPGRLRLEGGTGVAEAARPELGGPQSPSKD